MVFVSGQYEIQFFVNHARHNLNGRWTSIPLDSKVVVSEDQKYIQIARPDANVGEPVEIVFEFCGSWMM